MTTTFMINALVFAILQITSIIIFFIVLIKLFKTEGALKGILGFLCGLYTFIWGWLKHKELQMTKLMAVWSIILIIFMVGIPLVGTTEIMKMATTLQGKGFDVGSFQKGKTIKPWKKPKIVRPRTKRAGAKTAQTMDSHKEAVALWKNGKYTNPRQALIFLNKAVAKDPKFANVYSNRGNAYRDLKQYPKALNDYNKAISLNPSHVKAYNNRGNVYYEQKKYQQALKDYNQCLRLKPNYTFAYINRGLVFYQLKNKSRACKDFQKACQLGDCDGLNWAKGKGFCK
ncbi:MAG: tetratricopeptide repeat protein [Deltaproteobacteria bacterium]|nr:tetratricopeptide repeat protein [Deltaproteobacteria bacterium]